MDTVERIIKLMENNQMTKYKLAKEIEISNGIVSDWANGKSKSYMKYLDRIAELFNVSTDYLICLTDDPIDYENVDDLGIPSNFDGDAEKYYKFKVAEMNDMKNEHEEQSFNQKIISICRILNNEGKMEALKRVEELAYIPKYTDNKNTFDHLMPVAAHNDNSDDDEQQRLMNEDLEEL